MFQLLVLAHAAIAVFLVFTRPLDDGDRARLVRFGALVGVAAAAVLFLTRGAESSWGAATLRPGAGAVIAAAIACAWVLVAVTDAGRGRWDIGALVGSAATGLALFGTSEWVVPALLFWVVVSAATAAAARYTERSAGVWLAVVLSDVCFVATLIVVSLDEERWAMPEAVEGWLLVPLVVAIAIRTAIVPGIGLWGLATGTHVAMLPLVIGSGFALVPSVSGGEEIGVALAVLAVALAAGAWSVIASSPRISSTGAWIVALMLAVAWIEPRALGRAGTAAVLGAAVAVMWPRTSGRAQGERGLVLAAVPLTVAFGVIVGGATVSFERASLAETVVDSVPWSAFAALLPVALAAGVTLGAATARRVEPELYQPGAVVATWGLAAVALILGLSARPELGFVGAGPAIVRTTWLYVVAALAALVAARLVPRDATIMLQGGKVPVPGPPRLRGPFATAVQYAAATLAIPTLGAVAWFTYTGLRTGFL